MQKIICFILMAMAVCFTAPVYAQVDDEEESYKTQVPTGMELQQVGKKSSYRMVLPKGTALRREGNLRIVEGTGEYASRKFVDYDARLDQMSADIESIRKDVEEIKKTVSEMQKATLASK